jgi:putative DNA methylase
MPQERPPVLIEHWLPIAALGAESKRERGASSALPPLYFLHVWWARRPLTVSRAAILASVLPQWSAQWPDHLKERFPDEDIYHKWFIYLTGIRGDPVKGRQLIDWAKVKGVQLPFHPYGGAPRAFTVSPAEDDLEIMRDLLEVTWGTRDLTVLDPFAGGGSIPFESLRYGFTTIANDLNPVATTILKATLDYPARFGPSLANDIKKWGDIWAKRVEEKLAPYFPKQPGENIFAYLWARTVACPETGKPVPLSPNWWLRTGSKPVAVKLIAEPDMDAPSFEILEGDATKAADPDTGTISRGIGRSPWTGQTIPGDYIKAEAQAGRMGQMLYAVVVKKLSSEFEFRVANSEDLGSVRQAETDINQKKVQWLSKDLIPLEEIGLSNYDRGHRLYGMYCWADFFTTRQLLAIGTYLETMQDVLEEAKVEVEKECLDAIHLYFGVVLDKVVIYNNRSCRFDPNRGIRSSFDKHNYAFVWSHAEFDASTNLLHWAVNQTVDAFGGLANLINPAQVSFIENSSRPTRKGISIYKGQASQIAGVPENSVHNITVDPPYYDNVQYAELSDFFYVWLKRSVGHLFPDFFNEELTNKDDEAVANPARFADLGRNKKKLAEQDYERKMAAAFREMHRVLHPDGVLTVMFTHKQVEAWDTLASALIGAGFVIKSSWPVHTESEHSLHQAKKNAAASTILLVCRKRKVEESEPIWWDDIQGRVRSVARASAADYAAQGVGGVDLYISTFGPTLSVISEQWPVLTSEVDPQSGHPKPLRPETALDLARGEVIRLRKEGLLAGRAITFDAVTDWYLMAWDAFQATEFPFDEARKLALALGLDLDLLLRAKKLVVKKGNYVAMQEPGQRRKRGMVDPDAAVFEHLIDALHTAMLIYAEDGAGACDVFLINRGLKRDTTFLALLQAAINAIPRTQIKGKFIRPEADLLDRLRLAFYANDLTVPVEEVPDLALPEQPTLWGESEVEDEGEEDDEMDHDE